MTFFRIIFFSVFCAHAGCWRLRAWRRQRSVDGGERTPGCKKHDREWQAEVREIMRSMADENPGLTLIERRDGTTALVQAVTQAYGLGGMDELPRSQADLLPLPGLGVETADDLEAIAPPVLRPSPAMQFGTMRFDQVQRAKKLLRKRRRG